MILEHLLNRQQKEEIIASIILQEFPLARFRIRYDRRYGWDFAATKRGHSVSVVMSVSIDDPRFGEVIKRIVWALHDFKTMTHAKTIRGQRRVEA